jgi:UDP-N-acetyl-D-mannosaminuronic acid dehydrogenase
MPEYVVKLVKKALAGQLSRRAEGRKRKQNKPILSRRIACLGLAYKADVGDTRESPAIKVIELLRAEGFDVQAYDPHVQIEVIPGQVHSLEAALNGADLVLILTDHKEFKGLDLKNFAVVDTRNLLDDEFLKVNGSFCIKLGKGF